MKVIEDILKEVDQEVLRKAPHAQRKYNKITETLRVKFLNKIFQENKSIKKAAEELNINYSSAKTILTMHRKKSKNGGSSPSCADLTNPAALSQDFATASQQAMARALPPKHLIKQSFMSTASNLSEQKDFEDSCSDNHDELKGNNNIMKKQLIQNRNLVLVAPQAPNNIQVNPLSQIQQKNTSIIIPPPQQQQPALQQSAQIPTAISQNILLQLQQQFQVQQQQQQQQQQQLQNTLQQLLLLQLAQTQQAQQQPVQPAATLNPLATLLLQQQLLGQLPSAAAPMQQKFF
ncbi:hypothetical protein TTHERM_00526550 (macronuclear) [Tetrahymena thermophila SB210]|uniref:Uncharacterized protein n=1 Tax=Tetrahymena thermophila (strain SB210) TaxID=312017 RepID=I7LY72_TETTS|nr:hypothetical protein TTHERM_00526550 [Tetrahymena thermophila SB210]EAS07824.2 hypothetical protein TTHERM_00526550 [Tetrahymena thermophila SB210]|eukprot:XP_001028066.2 hypothetical protein TTHERM_00526550 [Tetrahymena thermophila SB210]